MAGQDMGDWTANNGESLAWRHRYILQVRCSFFRDGVGDLLVTKVSPDPATDSLSHMESDQTNNMLNLPDPPKKLSTEQKLNFGGCYSEAFSSCFSASRHNLIASILV